MELTESLRQLADQNRSGAAFLLAYGVAWVACGIVWQRAGERVAALVTLFHGLVAFPVALGLSAAMGAFDQERPVPEVITQLSVLVGTSQLLGLPFLAFLVATRAYPLVPVAFAAVTSMHFVLYSWLYRTPSYVVMAALISLGTTTVMLLTGRDRPRQGAASVCHLTGGLLLATAVVLLAS